MPLFKRKNNIVPRRRLELADDDTSTRKMPVSYMRNQTLAGAPPAHSPRAQTHHLAIKRRKAMSVFAIIILSALTIWLLISNFTATAVISVPNTITSKTVDKSIYAKVIQDYFDVNPIGRFSFLLDQAGLQSFVISKLPEVGTLEQVGSAGIGKTNFNIKMRTPVAGWMINNKQYFVDAQGVSFRTNYFDQPDVQIVDQSGAAVTSGSAIVSQRFLSFVGRVVSQSKNRGYSITEAILPLNTTRELEVRTREGDYLVKLSIDRPVGEQIEDMDIAIRYFISHGQKPAYIDVRVSGKAFYK